MLASIMTVAEGYLLPVSLWLIMFAMGLSLRVADFAKIIMNRKAFVLGAGSMLLLVPAVGTTIAIGFMPTQALMMGFILLATCPGGLLSNLLTDLSRGDLALSVSMSLFTSIVYIFALPFICHFALILVYGEGKAVSVPLGSSFWHIIRVTVIPIACGMAVNAWQRAFAAHIVPTVKNVGTSALVVIFGLIVVDNLDTLRAALGLVMTMVIAMNLINFLIALTVSRLGRLRREERIAVVIEHLIRQEATAIYVAVAILGRSDMSLPMIVNTFVGMFFCVGFVAYMKRRAGVATPQAA